MAAFPFPFPHAQIGCLVLGFVLAASPSGAGENSATKLSREASIRMAIKRNPEIGVAALEIDRAKSRLRWAGRLDNPELELSGMTDQFGLNEGEGGFEIAFSQRFPVTARLRREKEVRRHDVELAEIELHARMRQLAYEVDKAWIQWRAARQSEQLQTRLLKLNEEISDFLADRSKLGEVSPLDAIQAKLNGKLLKQELGVAKAGAASAKAKLRKLLGLDPGVSILLTDDFPFPKSAPSTSVDLKTVLSRRPDYALLLAAGAQGSAQLDLAMAQRWDDIALKVFVESENANDEPGGLERNNFVGIGFSIPLPLRNRNQEAIDDARIDIEKARRARGAMAFAIHSDLQRTLLERKAAWELADESRGEALTLAKKNLEAFQKAQQEGQATVLQVQQAQAQLLELETSALELRKAYELTDAEVRLVSGNYPVAQRVSKNVSK